MKFTGRGGCAVTPQMRSLLSISGRVKDWLYGIRAAQPDKNALIGHPLSQAERYRTVYRMITGSKEDGGAQIVPKKGQWKNVESLFPLHDKAFNKQWIKRWSTMTFLKPEDFDEIRNRLGEKVNRHD